MSQFEKQLEECLNAVLSTEYFKEQQGLRNIADEIAFHGFPERDTDFLLEILNGFFEEDVEKILEVKPIWQYVSAIIKRDLEDVWENKDTVLERLNDRGYITTACNLNDIIERLSTLLRGRFEARLDTLHAGKTTAKLLPSLRKGCIFVATLDNRGKVMREPFPVTMNAKATVDFSIGLDYAPFKNRRVILVTIDPPIETTHGRYVKRAIQIRPHEVKAEIIKT